MTMQTISSIVEKVLKKYSHEIPMLKDSLSTNLEFRLLFSIDLSKPFKEARKEFIKNYLNDVLTLSLGNISTAAKKAQLHRRHIHRMINELDVDPESHRRQMLKPEEYMKTYVYNVLEETLSGLDPGDKLSKVYSQMEDISSLIARDMGSISFDDALQLFEKEYIERALKANGLSIPRTAHIIRMSERTLYRKVSRLGLAVIA
jgi:DNA-binding NtrC family response regulator